LQGKLVDECLDTLENVVRLLFPHCGNRAVATAIKDIERIIGRIKSEVKDEK